MKKILLLIAVSVSTICSAQRIGKVQHFEWNKADGGYSFIYSDYKFQHINVDKSFYLSEDEFHELYNIMIQGFSDAPKERILFETKQDQFSLKYSKAFGVVNLQIYHSVLKTDAIGLSKYLTKKAAIKLFGFKK